MRCHNDPLLAAYIFSDKAFDLHVFESCLQAASASRLALFGAGGWGEALFEELVQRDISLPIVFTDNDSTKHGRRFRGKAIIPPEDLRPDSDLVLITTISAGKQVSMQLQSYGFERDINYFEVMHNQNHEHPLHVIDVYSQYVSDLSDMDILHIGPGGNMGVELLLGAFGARSVYSVERNSFRLSYPDVTYVKGFYEKLDRLAKKRRGLDLFQKGLFISKDDHLYINQNRIHLLYPCSVTALPFKEASFDLVLHFGVFEHVSNPEQGYREIFRVLRKGGITVGNVGPLDHRSMSSHPDFHPLKFLEHSRDEWYEISKKMNFHNQMTTPEHKEMIREPGFSFIKWTDGTRIGITEEMWNAFHPMFKKFEKDELGILEFCFSAQKPLL